MAYISSQTNFSGGEISRRLHGRIDIDQYKNSVETLENMTIHPHGGISSRNGFRLVTETKYPDKASILIPFQHSVEQAYAIEVGDLYLRFCMDGGQIESAPDTPVEVVTPYAEGDIALIKYCQSADVMFLVHPNFHPKSLSRTDHETWTLADLVFISPPAEWTAGNYPSSVMFYEQRLCFSGVPSDPQRIWGSRTGSYYDMSVGATLEADDPIDFTIAADQVNVVRWMMPSDNLGIGTVGGAWMMSGTAFEPLSPASVEVKRHTTSGAADVQPVQVSNAILYVSRTGRALHELVYKLEDDRYSAPDLLLLAEHLTREHPIVELAYQQDPDSVLWCLRTDGSLLSMTYMRDQGVVGWAKHTTSGSFESVCSIQGYNRNEIYVTTSRVINGSTVRFIETLGEEFIGVDLAQAFNVDCGLSYYGAATDTFAGADHLNGEMVAVLADGKVHPPVLVTAGEFQLNYDAEVVHAGLPYTCTMKTLKLEETLKAGTTQGRFKRIAEVILMFTDTMGCKAGADADSLYPLLFNEEQVYGSANDLFSGSKEVAIDGGWSREASITVVQDQPLPITLNSISLMYEVS